MACVKNRFWDALGISASVLCALHCTVLPVAISSFSIAGAALWHHPALEAALLATSFLAGCAAFYKGCFVQHKNKTPLLFFVTGFGALLLAQAFTLHAFLLVPFAAVTIAAAHIINYKYGKKNAAAVID